MAPATAGAASRRALLLEITRSPRSSSAHPPHQDVARSPTPFPGVPPVTRDRWRALRRTASFRAANGRRDRHRRAHYRSRVLGIVRPCRHHLSPALHRRWAAHLCGTCLALRDGHGQLARAATNVDALLVSVLTSAQTRVPGVTTDRPPRRPLPRPRDAHRHRGHRRRRPAGGARRAAAGGRPRRRPRRRPPGRLPARAGRGGRAAGWPTAGATGRAPPHPRASTRRRCSRSRRASTRSSAAGRRRSRRPRPRPPTPCRRPSRTPRSSPGDRTTPRRWPSRAPPSVASPTSSTRWTTSTTTAAPAAGTPSTRPGPASRPPAALARAQVATLAATLPTVELAGPDLDARLAHRLLVHETERAWQRTHVRTEQPPTDQPPHPGDGARGRPPRGAPRGLRGGRRALLHRPALLRRRVPGSVERPAAEQPLRELLRLHRVQLRLL